MLIAVIFLSMFGTLIAPFYLHLFQGVLILNSLMLARKASHLRSQAIVSSSLRTGMSARTEKKFGEQSERFKEREAQGERSVPSRFGERIRLQALSAVTQRQ